MFESTNIPFAPHCLKIQIIPFAFCKPLQASWIPSRWIQSGFDNAAQKIERPLLDPLWNGPQKQAPHPFWFSGQLNIEDPGIRPLEEK